MSAILFLDLNGLKKHFKIFTVHFVFNAAALQVKMNSLKRQ